ncbi:hypothetical protein PROSTU_03687 [Providencia stuartii ATCC 25827]|uniref:Uncharacterized protein n=1 Tax=Providencia stuartii ATCC 25827 TaxID=471874 RepID=A0AA87CU30_PROST|nr:hypothetical protein PROSTU_03687 [Providencia stuartii ATCC 25827]
MNVFEVQQGIISVCHGSKSMKLSVRLKLKIQLVSVKVNSLNNLKLCVFTVAVIAFQLRLINGKAPNSCWVLI